MKKRSFLLIEVIIAFSLASICIIPLISQPIHLYRKESEHLEQMEKSRLANLAFTEVKEIFLRNEIPWDELPAKRQKSKIYPLPDGELQLPGKKPKAFKRSFTLTGKGDKIAPKGWLYKQLDVYIKLDDETFCFRMPVQKIGDK